MYYVSTFLNTLNIYHSLQHFKESLTKDIRFFMYSPLHFLTLTVNVKRMTNGLQPPWKAQLLASLKRILTYL